ncbi:MAG TPA: VWA domain-containing protein [Blastocatellia bacterium]|nr:VWA domain-containing protein [Blastocatellia bacterium]
MKTENRNLRIEDRGSRIEGRTDGSTFHPRSSILNHLSPTFYPRYSTVFALFISSWLIALTLHSSAVAHQRKKLKNALAQEAGETIRIDSSLVEVPVSVTDAAGRPVRNLTARDFWLEENGRLQQIVSLGDPGEARVEIALLFDITASVYDLFHFERQAALRFLREALKPRDAVSIFTIGIRPRLIRSRAVGIDRAIRAAMTIEPTKEPTAFFDAVAEAARYLDRTAAPGAKRVVVVISDGEDMLSANHTVGDALKELQRSDCLFYSINPSGPSIRLNKISLRAQDDLISLASATGGAAFLPASIKDLDDAFGQIASDLRAQYLLGYYSTAERADGRFRRINVRVPRRPDLRLRTRQGYYASRT